MTKSVNDLVNFHRLRWSEHLLHMSNQRSLRWAILSNIGVSWKNVSDSQTKIWY